jgi:hypothetical protein
VLCSDGLTTMVRGATSSGSTRRPTRNVWPRRSWPPQGRGEDNVTVVWSTCSRPTPRWRDPTAVIAEPTSGLALGSHSTARPPAPRAAPQGFAVAVRGDPGSPPLHRRHRRCRAGVRPQLYFVSASGNEVVIYKGVPGGVLGWNPTVDQRTGSPWRAPARPRLQTNSSRLAATAEAYVGRLRGGSNHHGTPLGRPPPRRIARRRRSLVSPPRRSPSRAW